MFDEIIRALLSTKQHETADIMAVLPRGYDPLPIDRKNLHPITGPGLWPAIFIDGGNAEILGSSDFSLQLVRVYYTKYPRNRRTESGRFDSYVLVSPAKEGYRTRLFNINNPCLPQEMCMDPNDSSIADGRHRASPQKIIDIFRRCAEIRLAAHVAGTGKLIVLDGTLDADTSHESDALGALFMSCSNSNTEISALAKSCSLVADNGKSVSFVLSGFGGGPWYYNPLASSRSGPEICFARLHRNSSHVFRIDARRPDRRIFSTLAENSRDALFPGYPYGLIEADRFARVSNKERENLKAALIARSGLSWPSIRSMLSSSDTHSILDRIS
ncbi:MAG: hypothetical protein ABH879_05975 [archaeon]